MKKNSSIVSLLFPLILSILLGGVGFLLNIITDIDDTKVELNPEEPQYIMNKINAKRFDQNGNLKNSLHAEQAWINPNDENVFFRQPELEVRENNKLLYTLSSDNGVYNREVKQVDLTGNVKIKKYDVQGKLTAQSESDSLHIDEVEGNFDTIARNISKNIDNELNSKKQRVKAIIYDTQKR